MCGGGYMVELQILILYHEQPYIVDLAWSIYRESRMIVDTSRSWWLSPKKHAKLELN